MANITTSKKLSDFVSTSTSALSTVPTNQTITIEAGKALYSGQLITVVVRDAKIPTRVRGTITAYDSATGILSFAFNTTQWVENDTSSTTSLTIGTGSKTLSTIAGLNLIAGDPVRIQQISGLRSMVGTVTTYDNITGALTVNVTSIVSSGTYADWTVCSEGTFSDIVVSFQQGDVLNIINGATLTVDVSPTIRPGTVQCITSGKLRIENSSTTEPLIFNLHDMDHDFVFKGGGVFEIRGQPMYLDTGNETQQTWDFTTLFGDVIRHMTYVEVQETPGGVYVPWPVIQEDPKFNLSVGLLAVIGGADPTAFTAGNTKAGRALFWHETNRTLRTGNGTNGSVIPSGCNIQIPNIYISNRLLTNATKAFNIYTTGVPTAGTFTIHITRENGTVLGTTAAIAFNATAAVIDTAIEAITGVGTVTSAGGALPTAVSITWAGTYANERLAVKIGTSALTGGTNPQVYLYENSSSNLTLLNLNPLGTLDAEWCSFSDKIRFYSDVFKAVRLISVGSGSDYCNFINTNGTVEIDGLHNCQSPFIAGNTPGITNNYGLQKIKRVTTATKNPSGFSLQNLPLLTGSVDYLYRVIFGKRSATSNRTFVLQTLPTGQKFKNFTMIGAAATMTNLTKPIFVNYSYADGTLNVQDTSQITNVIQANNVIDPIFANYSDAGPMMSRASFYGADAQCAGAKILGGTMNGRNQMANFGVHTSAGLEFKNWVVSNLRTGALLDLPTNFLANGLVVKKVFVNFASAESSANIDACQDGQYDLVTASINGINEAFVGVNNFVGGNYASPSLTPKSGHITFGPFAEGTGLVTTGAAFADGLGKLFLPNDGDTATVTMPFSMHAITAFMNCYPALWVQGDGVAGSDFTVIAPGGPTGGTFTISVYKLNGTLIGTTAAQAINVTATNLDTALTSLVVAGGFANSTNVVATSGSTIGGGYNISFSDTMSNQAFYITVNGAALTGGTEPGVAYAYCRGAGTKREMMGRGENPSSKHFYMAYRIRAAGGVWGSWSDFPYFNLTNGNKLHHPEYLEGQYYVQTNVVPEPSGITNPFTTRKTMTRLTETTTNAAHTLSGSGRQHVWYPSGTQICGSVVFGFENCPTVSLKFISAGIFGANLERVAFNLQTGAFTFNGANGIAYDLGGGFWRICVVATTTAAGWVSIQIEMVGTDNSALTYAGTGRTLLADTCMINEGATPNSYDELNIVTAISSLTDYTPFDKGLEMELKFTAVGYDPYRAINQVSIPTIIEPDSWLVTDSSIEFKGMEATDVVYVIDSISTAVLYTFTGPGVKEFTLGANFDASVYFRRDNAAGMVLMTTFPATKTLVFGDNGVVNLFYGAQVQLADSSTVSAIKTSLDTNLPLLAKEASVQSNITATNKAVSNAALAAALSA